jgi:hypothetical protein
MGILGIGAGLVLGGCSQQPQGAPISASDPGGLGSPQERLKMLDANTTMDPRLKAKKRAIIEDEINGTHTAFGHPHQ